MLLGLNMDMMMGAAQDTQRKKKVQYTMLCTENYQDLPTPAGMGEGQVSMVGVLHIWAAPIS